MVAVPVVHRFPVGADKTDVPLAAPQDPLMGAGALGAVHMPESAPPSTPLQLHVQGPDPETAVGVPVLHKLLAGADKTDSPLALPHAPA